MEAEFDRVEAIFRLIVEFLAPTRPEMLESISTKEESLERVTSGKATFSEIISGIQMAINDFTYGLINSDPKENVYHSPDERGPDRQEFLAFYKARTGREYFTDVKRSDDIIRKVMKKQKISDELEHYVLAECLNDLDQTVLGDEEIRTAERMVSDYEDPTQSEN